MALVTNMRYGGKYSRTSFCCKCSGPSKWVTKRKSCTKIVFANDSIYPNEPACRKLDGPDDYLFFVDNPVHPKEPVFCTVGAQDKNLTLQIFRIGRPFVKKTIKMIISFCKSESSHRACQAPSKVQIIRSS